MSEKTPALNERCWMLNKKAPFTGLRKYWETEGAGVVQRAPYNKNIFREGK